MKPEEAYRAGYEKGRNDNLIDNVGEAFSEMMRDDPGGYYGAGYRDGAALRKFNPHGDKEGRSKSPKSAPVSLPSSLESQWYGICDASEFIPKETVDWWLTKLYAAGSQVAALIGLSNFTDHVCPHCGARGHFKIHFLGSLKHPECRWSGYMKTGSYIGHQIAQIFHTGVRAGGAMKDEADKKPDRSGNWIYAILGFLFVAIFRAMAAVVLIPLHCIAALFQPGQTTADIVARVTTLGIVLTAFGIGFYEIQLASRAPNRMSQQVSIFQVPDQRVARPTGGLGSARVQDASSAMAEANAEQARLNRRLEATQRLMLAMELDDAIGASKALEDGADPNMTVESAGMRTHFQPPFSDDTSLHLAILFKSVALARLLIGHGANVNLRGAPGIAVGNGNVDLTPLREAIAVERPEIVSLLLENGADPNLDQPLKDALHCAETPNGIDGKMSVACAQIVAILKGAQGVETYLGPKPPVANVPYFFDSDGDRWNLFPIDVCPDRRTQNGELTTYTIDGQLASANITVSHRGAAFYVRYAQSDLARQQTLILAPLAEKVGRRETSGVNGLSGLPSIRGTQVAPNIWRYETHDAIPGGQYWVVLPSLDPPFFCFQYNPL